MTYTDKYGTHLPYPKGLFSEYAGEDVPQGPVFRTRDGAARLHVFALPNDRKESPRAFLDRVFPKDRADKLSYARVTRNFFVVSEPKDGQALYRRCNFVRQTIHCFDIRYPLSQKRAYDATVTFMSHALGPR